MRIVALPTFTPVDDSTRSHRVTERIATLRALVDAGEYGVDLDLLAERMIDEDLSVRDPRGQNLSDSDLTRTQRSDTTHE
ncbi:MAG TPA: flagellar biosynthesis anti-sigma factor FlgM [Kofleriaceae bacterium]|nr:flagellar biosynthesis anti-sigma factor FlgM [Kofleriaceae bacterium]